MRKKKKEIDKMKRNKVMKKRSTLKETRKEKKEIDKMKRKKVMKKDQR